VGIRGNRSGYVMGSGKLGKHAIRKNEGKIYGQGHSRNIG